MKHLLVLLFISTFAITAKAYKIKVEIKGAKDSTVYLAVHFGNNKYVRDTAILDSQGNATFSKDKTLAGGMYLVAMGGSHIFDFLISNDNEQSFVIKTTKGNYTQDLHFKNSPENEAFANFTRFIISLQKSDAELMKRKQGAKGNQQVSDEIETLLNKNKESYFQYLDGIKTKFPNSLLVNIVRAMNPVDMPELIVPEGTPGRDSILYHHYYEFQRNHYFDNYALTDKRMLNTPILLPAVDQYFDNILIKRTDSIIVSLDRFIKMTSGDPDTYKFFVGHLFNKYMQSDIMGMETVVVHIIDRYYLSGEIKNNDEKFMNDIKEYAIKNRPTLIGKKAANLKMESLTGQYETLYDIEAPYTLVYFFEPSCGHCKKETPKVYQVYEKYKDKGLASFIVYAQSKKEEWIEYVSQKDLQWNNVWDPTNENDFRRKYSIYLVPQVYLLDKDKVIIGRRLNHESLDLMLSKLLK